MIRLLYKQEPENEKKARLILDTLDRRGHRGVKSLYNAFQETGNDELAYLLEEYAQIVDKKEHFNDPIGTCDMLRTEYRYVSIFGKWHSTFVHI